MPRFIMQPAAAFRYFKDQVCRWEFIATGATRPSGVRTMYTFLPLMACSSAQAQYLVGAGAVTRPRPISADAYAPPIHTRNIAPGGSAQKPAFTSARTTALFREKSFPELFRFPSDYVLPGEFFAVSTNFVICYSAYCIAPSIPRVLEGA